MIKSIYSSLLILCMGILPSYTLAAAYQPTKSVTLIVPFPPGGGTDRFARILGLKLSDMWGQTVVVENRSGAQGSIGTAHVAKAAPDGYTLLVAHQGVFAVNPHLYKDTGFDPFKDFVPVARATQQPFVLVVNDTLPVKTLKELVTLAKSEPGQINFGSATSGAQLAGELLKHNAGIDMLSIAYKGAAPGVVDVLGGHINLMVATPPSIAQHVKDGKLRALVLFGSERISAIPDAPTAAEAGYPALGDMPEWYGIVVPAGTPANLVVQMNQDINVALQDPDLQRRAQAQGLIPAPTTPEKFAAQIRRDYDSWGEIVKKMGLKAQ
ncbi:MAG: tripartite tricarboxylate transporter substrate binding protein [Paralcaligenes sp.]